MNSEVNIVYKYVNSSVKYKRKLHLLCGKI